MLCRNPSCAAPTRTVLQHVGCGVVSGSLGGARQQHHVVRRRVELHRELGHPRLVRQDVAHQPAPGMLGLYVQGFKGVRPRFMKDKGHIQWAARQGPELDHHLGVEAKNV